MRSTMTQTPRGEGRLPPGMAGIAGWNDFLPSIGDAVTGAVDSAGDAFAKNVDAM